MISQTVNVIVLYSLLAEDLEMVVCFLDFHAIAEPPSIMQKPMTDFLVNGQSAQLASQYACNCK